MGWVSAGIRATRQAGKGHRMTLRVREAAGRKTNKPRQDRGLFVCCRKLSPDNRCSSVEAAGIAPASREASVTASTCVSDLLIVGLGAPVGRVPFGLSGHEFNPSRNQRLGSSDPELASPA